MLAPEPAAPPARREEPLPDRLDLLHLAATLRVGEKGSWSSPYGWVAQHVAERHVRAHLDDRIAGPM